MFDVTEMRPAEVEADIYRLMHADLEVILVPNKMDLNPYTLPEDYIMPGITRGHHPHLRQNQMNIIYLKERILQTIHSDHALLAQNIVSNARHVDSLVSTGAPRARTHAGDQSIRT
ncbi:MAG: hypothetical protein IPP04_02975 [Saprospiraceae bacterium]|nr:hypothetical protein [Saprospiraceae bacterium]